MKLVEIASSSHSCQYERLWDSFTCPLRDVCSSLLSVISCSLPANPMEELSTCEATCLVIAMPVKEETTKLSPVPTERLCYYSLHDQHLSVAVGACGLWDSGIQAS